ncbi:MAG: orotidine 5'-phosphate decarboxylase [Candidatus Aenigmarchaeota archaeon]|nr:orotidine 5'-phosphate decarboxylase [Candidatus Aenigmarchaeota archaeon]MDI6722701.1 orotidine 5'-phosphate decarboxylase [Candidatus Aenigmarchaeota archaeon]
MVEAYKAQFIQFLLDREVLKIGGPYELKSKRLSPYFLKLDEVSDGEGLNKLGDAYADAILANIIPGNFDGVIGIPNKAHVFGPAIPMALARKGANKAYSSWRDKPKTYGDATALGQAPRDLRQSEYILGAKIPDGSRQILADDVMTAGDSKEDALKMIDFLAEGVVIPALVIAANRQEIDEYGENAIESFSKRHDIPVIYPISVGDIFDYLKESDKLSPHDGKAFMAYLRSWGTKEAREKYGLKSGHLIEGRSVIPACDTDSMELFEEVVKETAGNSKIGGYKIGFELGLNHSLPKVVETARRYTTDKKIIYDHQKAGTDIGDVQMARKFAKTLKNAGVDAVIFFPQSGPVTQTAWTGEALQEGLHVIIGGHMTHKGYLESEHGYIRDSAPEEIYRRTARHGINSFVVPGNKTEFVEMYKKIVESEGSDPEFFAPGFITQGGSISEAGKVAGDNFHAIVGRDLMNAENKKEKAGQLTSQL